MFVQQEPSGSNIPAKGAAEAPATVLSAPQPPAAIFPLYLDGTGIARKPQTVPAKPPELAPEPPPRVSEEVKAEPDEVIAPPKQFATPKEFKRIGLNFGNAIVVSQLEVKKRSVADEDAESAGQAVPRATNGTTGTAAQSASLEVVGDGPVDALASNGVDSGISASGGGSADGGLEISLDFSEHGDGNEESLSLLEQEPSAEGNQGDQGKQGNEGGPASQSSVLTNETEDEQALRDTAEPGTLQAVMPLHSLVVIFLFRFVVTFLLSSSSS